MTLLAKSQLRFLRHVPWSALTALLAITLGVASVVAVHQICSRADALLRETMPPHLADLSHLLRREGLDADAYFALRAGWRRGAYPSIEAMVPIVEGRIVLGGKSVLVIGADWLSLLLPGAEGPALRSPDGAWSGLGMLAQSQVLADTDLRLPGGTTLMINDRPYPVAGAVTAGMGPALFADIAVAHELLGLSVPAVSYIGIRLHDSWLPWRKSLERLMPGLSVALPGPVLPETLPDGWQVWSVARELPSVTFARAVLFNLGALGTLALLVAWFLIYQVAVIWLRRQRLLLTRLDALGVRPGELLAGFLLSFVGFGILATVLGTALGQFLSGLLLSLSTADPGEAAGTPGLDAWVVGKAAVSGLGVCLAAGWAAFAREWYELRLPCWLLVLLVFLVSCLAVLGSARENTGVLGGFASILALCFLGVLMVTRLLSLFRRLTRHLRGRILLRMGFREAAWYPRVFGIAVSALALAIATSLAIGLMVESFRTEFLRMLDMRLAGDLYARGSAVAISQARLWLGEQPDVIRVMTSGRGRERADGLPVELSYGDFDAWEMGRYGYADALRQDEVAISERMARQLGLATGDTLRVANTRFTVVHIFAAFGDPVPRLLMNTVAARRLGFDPVMDRLTVEVRGGSDLGTRLTGRFGDLEVQPRADVRMQALRIFDRTFAATRALTFLALTVAVVGMYNALTALRLAQGPTRRLLNMQGLTGREMFGLTVLRSLTLGGLAVLLALPLGLGMAWVLCGIINPRAFGWTIDLQLPMRGWVPPLLLGLTAALLAGVVPAPRERGDLDASG